MIEAERPDLIPTPAFRQIASLLGAPIADIEDVRSGDICLVGLFEDHADDLHFGARFAARQIRYASVDEGRIGQDPRKARVLDLGDLNVFPLERERNREALIRQLAAVTEKNAVAVIVGGAFDMQPVMQIVLGRGGSRDVLGIRLPEPDPDDLRVEHRGPIALTIDMSCDLRSVFARERPLARLRRAIDRVPPALVRAVHLTGLAPELDLCGRHESGLGHHVLGLVAAHLQKAGG
jgi:hypothetical protein